MRMFSMASLRVAVWSFSSALPGRIACSPLQHLGYRFTADRGFHRILHVGSI